MHAEQKGLKVTYRVGFIVVLFLAGNACAHAASPLTPLQSASSLTSSFVAGRMVNPFAPDGTGGSAFLQNARGLTECNGKLYFNDDWGLRETDPATGRVTTLTRSKLNGVDLWCDGANLYATSNVDAHLTVEQITIATLERSSFSYPQVGSLVRPLYAENVFGQGTRCTRPIASPAEFGRSTWQLGKDPSLSTLAVPASSRLHSCSDAHQ